MLRSILPDWKNVLAALASAILLTCAFPDFEFWFLAWFALVPLMWAVEREKESAVKSFVLGWIFGTVFFFGTCWWLTFAPITYAGFPPALAYILMFGVTAIVGIFPGIFASVLSLLLKRFGSIAILAAPFIWVFTEFLRYWLTGNNWNAIGYSQSYRSEVVKYAAFGGSSLVGLLPLLCTALLMYWLLGRTKYYVFVLAFLLFLSSFNLTIFAPPSFDHITFRNNPATANIVALQPNVPMSNLTLEKWTQLRQKHGQHAESALSNQKEWPTNLPTTVIFPESPMNFMYEDDPETMDFINSFAAKHNVSVLFNSAEPDRSNGKFFNSAVMVDPKGREVVQYDKIYLLPFGEAVPVPFKSFVPAFVGSFSYGKEYDLFPLGDAKAGVMICFESHFGQLSREYVRNGADVLIEMTNDGYLGPTPVLRQHLANAVFRAVETNRPVLRVTNVGITAYIHERGEVLDPAEPYTEDTRVWSVAKSDGKQTFYVRYGDWFAWLCSAVTIGLLLLSLRSRRSTTSGTAT